MNQSWFSLVFHGPPWPEDHEAWFMVVYLFSQYCLWSALHLKHAVWELFTTHCHTCTWFPTPPPECRRSRSGSHKLWKWVKKIAREWRRSKKKIIAHMLILFRRRFRKRKKALHAYTLTLPGLVLGEPEQRRVMICLSAPRRYHDGHVCQLTLVPRIGPRCWCENND